MKNSIRIFILAVVPLLFDQSCSSSDEKQVVLFDMEFDVLDSESNLLDIKLSGHYTLSTRAIRKLEKQSGPDHKNVVVIPTIMSITRSIAQRYKPGEIYNYNRKEIEQTILKQSTADLASYEIELTKLFIASVKLPDDLLKKLESEHQEKVRTEEEYKK